MIRNIMIVLLIIVCGVLGWELYESKSSLPVAVEDEGEDEGTVSSDRSHQASERRPPGKGAGRKPAKRSVPRVYEKIGEVNPGFGSRLLEKGMKGPDVATLRKRLILAGFTHLRNSRKDDYFDDELEKALMEYQEGTKYLEQMYAYQGIGGAPKRKSGATLCKQLLMIPPEDMVLLEYEVEKGDTLWKIADKHGLGADALAVLNDIANPSTIQVGEKIIVICHRRDIRRQ